MEEMVEYRGYVVFWRRFSNDGSCGFEFPAAVSWEGCGLWRTQSANRNPSSGDHATWSVDERLRHEIADQGTVVTSLKRRRLHHHYGNQLLFGT